MKNSLEKRLYKNLIISTMLIIISIAVSIALLAGIITQLTKLKKDFTDIAINIQRIAVAQKKKESYIKDIVLNYHNLKSYKSYNKIYKREKKVLDNLMKSVEKKISRLQSKDKQILGDYYINFYNLLTKHKKKENEIISYLNDDNYQDAIKTYKLYFKDEDKDFNNVVGNFFDITKSKADNIKAAAKKKILFIIVINLITFMIFIFVSYKINSTIAKDIAYLHKAVLNIKNGDYETEISLETEDELGELAVALDRMRQSYNKSLKLLKRFL